LRKVSFPSIHSIADGLYIYIYIYIYICPTPGPDLGSGCAISHESVDWHVVGLFPKWGGPPIRRPGEEAIEAPIKQSKEQVTQCQALEDELERDIPIWEAQIAERRRHLDSRKTPERQAQGAEHPLGSGASKEEILMGTEMLVEDRLLLSQIKETMNQVPDLVGKLRAIMSPAVTEPVGPVQVPSPTRPRALSLPRSVR
jgi:hypothetical protein